MYLPLAASHFSLVMAEKPWPLQAFWPLQEFAPPLQALWPLQALAPTHLPSPAAQVAVDMVAPARDRVAAAAASAAQDLEVIFICILQKKAEGASPASSDSSSRQTAPGDSDAGEL